jgi:hypothetical protein
VNGWPVVHHGVAGDLGPCPWPVPVPVRR